MKTARTEGAGKEDNMIYKHSKPFENGYNPVIIPGKHKEMMGMSFGVYEMKKGDVREFGYPGEEAVFDLLTGRVVFEWQGKSVETQRGSCFHQGARVMHAAHDVKVTVRCLEDAEIGIATVPNMKDFESRFYNPEDCQDANEHRGTGSMNDIAERLVRTFWSRSTCPETNFFLGEVVHFPGKWSSYPPHTHLEPEMYYFKMLPEDGFGLSMYCDDARKVENNDCLGFPQNTMHSQVVAPGYSEWYFWCIPLNNEKNIETIEFEQYKWAGKPGAKYFPEI